MNRKNKKFFSLATLVLCLAVIMFGVYAVSKNATLTVKGHIGLIAHDCAVSINSTIKNDAVKVIENTFIDEEGQEQVEKVYETFEHGLPSDERELFPTVRLGGTEEGSKVVELEEILYFSDIKEFGAPKDIVMKFEIINHSTFTIFATINTPILQQKLEEGEELTPEENTTSGEEKLLVKTSVNGEDFYEKKNRVKLAPNETKNLYVSFGVDSSILATGETDYLGFYDLTDFDVNLEFRKSFLVETNEDGEQIIKLGEKDGKEIEWRAVAYSTNDDFTFNTVTLTDKCSALEPHMDVNSMSGKYVYFIMDEIYCYSALRDSYDGTEADLSYDRYTMGKYVLNDFREEFGITQQDIESYNIISRGNLSYFSALGCYNAAFLTGTSLSSVPNANSGPYENLICKDAYTGEATSYWLPEFSYSNDGMIKFEDRFFYVDELGNFKYTTSESVWKSPKGVRLYFAIEV